MRIAIFGSEGMLGRQVAAEAFAAGHTPVSITHKECDISNVADVQIRVGLAKQGYADGLGAVINCAGVVPGGNSLAKMALANAAGPHVIHEVVGDKGTRPFEPGIRLVHVSTDCVFSGIPDAKRTRYSAQDYPDPIDEYGRTKLAGEPYGPGVVTVRCSFIGPEGGLLAWLLSQQLGATVRGYANALWTGSTSVAVARRLVEFATMKLPAIDDRGMLIHLATPESLSKYDVLRLAAEVFGRHDLIIEPTADPRIDRRLSSDVPLQPLDAALSELLEKWKHSAKAKEVV